MKTRTLLILGVLAVSASAATGEVRLKIEGGRHVIYNDGPAKLRASEDWLAARMQKASGFDELIESSAREFSVDPKLVKSVMLVESGFNPAAISRKGARGLMQLMPTTAKEVAKQQGLPYNADRLLSDPTYNLTLGRAFLDGLLERFSGSYVLSVAAYNAGPARVWQWVQQFLSLIHI